MNRIEDTVKYWKTFIDTWNSIKKLEGGIIVNEFKEVYAVPKSDIQSKALKYYEKFKTDFEVEYEFSLDKNECLLKEYFHHSKGFNDLLGHSATIKHSELYFDENKTVKTRSYHIRKSILGKGEFKVSDKDREATIFLLSYLTDGVKDRLIELKIPKLIVILPCVLGKAFFCSYLYRMLSPSQLSLGYTTEGIQSPSQPQTDDLKGEVITDLKTLPTPDFINSDNLTKYLEIENRYRKEVLPKANKIQRLAFVVIIWSLEYPKPHLLKGKNDKEKNHRFKEFVKKMNDRLELNLTKNYTSPNKVKRHLGDNFQHLKKYSPFWLYSSLSTSPNFPQITVKQ